MAFVIVLGASRRNYARIAHARPNLTSIIALTQPYQHTCLLRLRFFIAYEFYQDALRSVQVSAVALNPKP